MFSNWNGHCHCCGKETVCHTMSMFNEDLICMDCKQEEKKDPDYSKAVAADLAAIKAGNYNFKGIR